MRVYYRLLIAAVQPLREYDALERRHWYCVSHLLWLVRVNVGSLPSMN